MIFAIDSFKVLKAINKTKKATDREQIYSIRSCPNGCSLSAGFDESLNETSETILLALSVMLLRPSAITEIRPKILPTTILQTESRIFTIMPTMLAKRPLELILLESIFFIRTLI